MGKNKQSTDAANGDRAAGTAKLKMGVRDSGAKIGTKGGTSGENADQGNRNKRS
jgi:hypothetical protein